MNEINFSDAINQLSGMREKVIEKEKTQQTIQFAFEVAQGIQRINTPKFVFIPKEGNKTNTPWIDGEHTANPKYVYVNVYQFKQLMNSAKYMCEEVEKPEKDGYVTMRLEIKDSIG